MCSRFIIGHEVESTTAIWRFMARWKYEDLISNRQLWFSSVQHLRSDDEFEGKLCIRSNDYLNNRCRESSSFEVVRAIAKSEGVEIDEQLLDWIKARHRFIVKNSLVSSWSIQTSNADDTDELWRTYGEGGMGVGIRTSVAQLMALFDQDFLFGKIHYHDHFTGDKQDFDREGIQIELFRKRPPFRDEREFRIAMSKTAKRFSCPACERSYSLDDLARINRTLTHGMVVPANECDCHDRNQLESSIIGNGKAFAIDINAMINEVVFGPNLDDDSKRQLMEKSETEGININMIS